MKKLNIGISITLGCLFLFIGRCNNYVRNQRKENYEKYQACYYDNVTVKDTHVEPNKINAYVAPDNWSKYIIANTFFISVPPTVELRKDNDIYTKEIKRYNCGYKINSDNVVFQQKGLSINAPEAYQTYCRIIANVQKGELGEFLKSSEYEELSIEDIQTFQVLAKQSSDKYEVIDTPDVRWIKIEDTYGIIVKYVRNGANDHHTQVYSCYFFNDNRFVTITLSYRKEDASKWGTDFSNIVKTFKWNN